MRTLAAFVLALIAASGHFAQHRGGSVSPAPVNRAGAHSAFPAGQPTIGTTVVPPPGIVIPTGINLNTGLRPGGNGLGQVVPGRPGFRGSRTTGPAYAAYPIYVGGWGYYDNSYPGSYPGQQAAPQQGSVTVIYPPQPAPVIINQFGPGDGQYVKSYEALQSQTSEPPSISGSEAPHYLIAFKDHTIYSAVAYWVDGDTLHYFTNGSTHNQVSVSLIDRELTARLNQDSGVEVKLPAAK